MARKKKKKKIKNPFKISKNKHPLDRFKLCQSIQRNLRKHKKSQSNASLQDIADALNASLPKSERWFHKIYHSYGCDSDVNNEPQSGYIVDILNKQYKYAIEVDGSIHERADVRSRDAFKQRVLEKAGFEVLRVKAYDIDSAMRAIRRVLDIRIYGTDIFINNQF